MAYTGIQALVLLRLLGSAGAPRHTPGAERGVQAAAALLLAAAQGYLGGQAENPLAAGLFSGGGLVFMAAAETAASAFLYRGRLWDRFYLSFLYGALQVLALFFLQAVSGAAGGQTGAAGAKPGASWALWTAYLSLLCIALWQIGKRLPGWLACHAREIRFNRGGGLAAVVAAQLLVLGFRHLYRQALLEPYMRHWALFTMLSALALVCCLFFAWGERARVRSRLRRQKLFLLEENYRSLLKLYHEKAALLHDEKHHMRAIRRLLDEGRCQEAAAYAGAVEEQLEKSGRRQWSGHAFLDLLLNMKAGEAGQAGCEVQIACDSMAGLTVKDSDLCVLFGNLFDNAREANERRAAGAARFVRLECRRRGRMLVTTLVNPMAGMLRGKGGRLATTKEDKKLHGFGLHSVQRVVDDYDGYLEYGLCDGNFRVFFYLNAFAQGEA